MEDVIGYINRLRTGCVVYRGTKSLRQMAAEMEVGERMLARFLRGGYLGLGHLARIEVWLERYGVMPATHTESTETGTKSVPLGKNMSTSSEGL